MKSEKTASKKAKLTLSKETVANLRTRTGVQGGLAGSARCGDSANCQASAQCVTANCTL
jgi:hypothetical protein